MKKVLILLMVLGISSLANGAVDLDWSVSGVTVDVDEVAMVYIKAGTTDQTDTRFTGVSASTIAEIADIVALAAAGDNAIVQNPAATGYPGWWSVESKDTADPFNIATGNQYEVSIKGLKAGTMQMAVNSESGYNYMDVLVIPEPITIALLGLGGLLLRRRK